MFALYLKRAAFVEVCLLMFFVLSGCFMQSVRPFYTENLLADMPEMQGAWHLVSQGKEDISSKYKEPWRFSKDRIETFEKGVASSLVVRYFNVEGSLFADLSPAEPEEGKGPNPWWMMHALAVHSVCSVKPGKDSLSFTPLNGEWLYDRIKEKKILLPYMLAEGLDHPVLTASPEELVTFLKKYKNDPDVFREENAFNFKRLPAASSVKQ
jgi:hypothetical protein